MADTQNNISSLKDQAARLQAKPDYSEDMEFLVRKLRFLEEAVNVLGFEDGATADPHYYLPGLAVILEEIGKQIEKMS